jgi:hypothetical protein
MSEHPSENEQLGHGFRELVMQVLRDNLDIEIWDDRPIIGSPFRSEVKPYTITVDVYFDGEVICSDKYRK